MSFDYLPVEKVLMRNPSGVRSTSTEHSAGHPNGSQVSSASGLLSQAKIREGR